MRNFKKSILPLNYLLLLLIVITTAPVLASDGRGKYLLKFEDLQHKAAVAGKVRVIVKLAVQDIDQLQARSRQFTSPAPGLARTWGGNNADYNLENAISYSAEFVKFALGKAPFTVHHIYKSIPYMALEVSAEALATLELMPEVLDIEEDVPTPLPEPVEPSVPASLNQPMLNNTVNITGASNAWSMGYTGAAGMWRFLTLVSARPMRCLREKTLLKHALPLDQMEWVRQVTVPMGKAA